MSSDGLTPASKIQIEIGLGVPMRDGAVLRADVFRASDDIRRPVILIRTPYGRQTRTHTDPGWALDVHEAARAGYAVVVQDTRGAFASEGHFSVFVSDADDGEDTIAWAARQPWSDGRVGMVGVSYLGLTQMLAAMRTPPALRAVVPGITGSECYDGWAYQGGAFNLGLSLSWGAGLAEAALRRREAEGEDIADDMARLAALRANPCDGLKRLPLVALPTEISALEEYGEWLAHPDRDSYWQETAINDRYDQIVTPGLHIAGLFDCFLKGTLENYVGLRRNAGTEHARENQRLIIVPWGHADWPNEVVGDLWLGPMASSAAPDLPQRTLEWMNAFLKGEPIDKQPRVSVFVMGTNDWREALDWPLPHAVQTPYFLRAGGNLSRSLPGDERPDEFVYDPSHPVPTVGGNTRISMGGLLQRMGPRDRREVEERDDVLTYTSQELDEDVEVIGPVSATLFVSSSALDTDFTAALIDVYPDGRAIGLADGILRLRYRDGLATPEPLVPGLVYEVEIDLVAVANVFKAGHRIRVEISSSNFPRFDRNPNTGGINAQASNGDLRKADQKVFHDTDHASHVSLPLVAVR
ncbi:CocE/NonD family hydrolase [Nocardioides sp.]|uniref:CocE/NonD family hydrolase n=1 Tax=Nocardioides sp. TaxID=35761 RepID=UPI003D138FEE